MYMNKKDKRISLERLCHAIGVCKRCQLHAERTNIVFGEGNPDAKILFIGEAPGANEDKQGRPFVGRAGEILNELLASIGLKREDVYIANVLKCRPPRNRVPLKEEIAQCAQTLGEQIKIIDPRIIVPMGNSATTFIFEKFRLAPVKISEAAGKAFRVQISEPEKEITIIPVYHPAVAVYNVHKKPEMKAQFLVLKLTNPR